MVVRIANSPAVDTLRAELLMIDEASPEIYGHVARHSVDLFNMRVPATLRLRSGDMIATRDGEQMTR